MDLVNLFDKRTFGMVTNVVNILYNFGNNYIELIYKADGNRRTNDNCVSCGGATVCNCKYMLEKFHTTDLETGLYYSSDEEINIVPKTLFKQISNIEPV